MADTTQNVPLDAQNFANNVSTLASQHPWMQPTLVTHLALNGGTPQQQSDTAQTYKNVLDNTPSPIGKVYSDASINTQPSKAETTLSTVTNAHGPVPFTAEDISGLQKNLQAKGYGVGLPLNTWNSQWNYAFQQYTYAQQSKPGIGNVDSFNLFKRVLSDIAPSGWAPTVVHAVASYVTSLPGQLRQMVADVAGGAVGIGGALVGKSGYGNVVAANISKDLGDQSIKSYTDPKTGEHHLYIPDSEMTKRSVQDLSNIINLVFLKGALKGVTALGKAGLAIAENAGQDATVSGLTKALAENPAKLVTRSLPEEYATVPKYTFVRSLYQSQGDAATGLLSRFAESPVIGRMLPFIDANAADKSIYFTARDALGQTMRIPARFAVSQIQNRGMLTGLGLLATSEAEKALGGSPVYDATKTTPYAGVLGNALDVVSMLAGGSPEGLNVSKNVGKIISDAHQSVNDALGPIGLDSVIRNAYGISSNEIIKNIGQEHFNDHFVKNLLPQFAASHYAEQALQDQIWSGKLDRASDEYKQLMSQYEHDVLSDPDLMRSALESLSVNKTKLAQYYRQNSITQFGLSFKRNALTSTDKQKFFDGLNNLKAVHQEMPIILDGENRNELFGSSINHEIEDLRTAKLRQDWGSNAPLFSEKLAFDSPKFYALSKDIQSAYPDVKTLTRQTRYGSGVVATQDASVAGRSKANVFALRHDVPGVTNEDEMPLPKFADISNTQNTKSLAEKIKIFANRDELGLPEAGKKIEQRSPEYEKLRKLISSRGNVNAPTGQQLIDAYRNALISGGKLNADQVNNRISQLMNEYMNEKGFTGVHMVTPEDGSVTLLRPDQVKANMIAHDPKYAKGAMVPSYLEHNNINPRGVIGVARADTYTAQMALRTAQSFFRKLEEAGLGPDVTNAQAALEQEGISGKEATSLPRAYNGVNYEDPEIQKLVNGMRKVLITKFHYNAQELTRLDPIQLASRMWRDARNLASEAYLSPDASPALKASIARLKDAGYKVVLGTDIGHGYEEPLVMPSMVAQRTSLLRKAALRLGSDTTKVSDIDVSTARRQAVVDSVNKVLSTIENKNGVQPILGDDGLAIYSRLIQGARSGEYNMGRVESMFKGLQTRRLQGQILKEAPNLTPEELKEQLELASARVQKMHAQAHQVRDLSLKQMTKILTSPIDTGDITGNPIPGYTPEDASKIAKAVLRGYANAPTSLTGLAKAEDFIRASGAILSHNVASFMGQVPIAKNWKIGEGSLFNKLASLPNELVRLRDRYRYDLSPLFSARRAVKTSLKAAIQGVPVAARPYTQLQKVGATEEAMNILQRTMPEVYRPLKDLEPLDKYLAQNDIWNMYNPGHHMAWQAWNLAKQGKSDEEITKLLTRINTYGDRTALERSINTVFFPFSFNKTLYSQVGSYLLDHPGMSVLLDHAFNFYNAKNKNNAIGNWFDNHLPIIKQLQQLNAFEHGIGLGQFGGINAPYINEAVNLFMPQVATPNTAKDQLSTIISMVPALQELNSLLFNYQASTGKANIQGTAVETGKVGLWALQNLAEHAADLIDGHKRMIYRPMMTDQAQTNAGIQLSTTLKTQLAPAIAAGGSWPVDPRVPTFLQGQKINSTSIGDFVHHLYPSYDSSNGAQIAIQRATQARQYVQNLQETDPYRYPAFNEFQSVATKVIAKLAKTKDDQSIANVTENMRIAALNLAEQDSKFVSFYNKYYQSYFGPIEGLAK